jgi:putative endonuclease
MEYFVYILRSTKDGSLYVGHTSNLDRRLCQHNNPDGKSYTAKRGPWVLVHSEQQVDRSSAMRRERFLKSHAGAHEKKCLSGAPAEDG